MATITATTEKKAEAVERPVRFLSLRYDASDSERSARRLVLALRPEWQAADAVVEFVRFTDGITNTLLKAVRRRAGVPGEKKEEAEAEDDDREAILLRAYGPGTDVIIDRQREAQNHELLMRHGLAPELLARFDNGMLYRFVRGTVTRPDDMRRPDISLAIARRLAQWHAVVPCLPERGRSQGHGHGHDHHGRAHLLTPNLWTVMQKWILALPTATDAQQQRRGLLQRELTALAAELGSRPGLGRDGLVFAHTDLLSGNVIVLPPSKTSSSPEVTFIDYEYAVPSPAAFDIANHFAEWGGFDCDMAALPTVSQRRSFIDEYVRAYARHLPAVGDEPAETTATTSSSFDVPAEAARLMREVDLFRGLPGFYWGIWASIQATISDIDFDYASYSETRLAEYWAWKAERDGSRAASGAEMPLRERRWAQETDDTGHL